MTAARPSKAAVKFTELERGATYRILDANLNRSREGIRVCEDIARFGMDSRAISVKLKRLRHGVSELMQRFPGARTRLLAARDSDSDVSADASVESEMSRRGRQDIFYANIQRAKESLRVLEEFAKVVDPSISDGFRRLRFRLYAVEKEADGRIDSLRHTRPGRSGRAQHGTSCRRRGLRRS